MLTIAHHLSLEVFEGDSGWRSQSDGGSRDVVPARREDDHELPGRAKFDFNVLLAITRQDTSSVNDTHYAAAA